MPEAEYLQYGGQAIIEGVMMRSPNYFAVACRAPNGEIVLQTEALEKTWIGRQKWLKYPFLRGTLALLDAMALGIRSMRFATNIQMDPKYATEAEKEANQGAKAPSQSIQNMAVTATIIVSLAMGIFLFNITPNFVAEMFKYANVNSSMVKNLISEVVKVILFLGYIWLISRMGEIREVFRYHGAEHKAINTLEAHQDLTMHNCHEQTRLHPRCGTSFAIIVLIVGFIIFTFVPRYPITGKPGSAFVDVPVRVLVELVILPIIAGISYEMIRFAGKFRDEKFVMLFFKPGLWTQLITTVEPADKHVEVALTALKAVVQAEKTGELATSAADLNAVPAPAT